MKYLKIVWLVGLLAFVPLFINASENTMMQALADSIKVVDDTRIFPMAVRYQSLYFSQDPKSTLTIHQKALKIAIQTGDEQQQAAFQHRIALCLYSLHRMEDALRYDRSLFGISMVPDKPQASARGLLLDERVGALSLREPDHSNLHSRWTSGRLSRFSQTVAGGFSWSCAGGDWALQPCIS